MCFFREGAEDGYAICGDKKCFLLRTKNHSAVIETHFELKEVKNKA
jgi:hypothetical protein